jgi:hypothetical protein
MSIIAPMIKGANTTTKTGDHSNHPVLFRALRLRVSAVSFCLSIPAILAIRLPAVYTCWFRWLVSQ